MQDLTNKQGIKNDAMIEVFKTNVKGSWHADQLAMLLYQHFPGSKIDFDLDDCDKVLRIDAAHVSPETVTNLLQRHDCHCEVME